MRAGGVSGSVQPTAPGYRTFTIRFDLTLRTHESTEYACESRGWFRDRSAWKLMRGRPVVHVWLQGCPNCMPAFEAMRRLSTAVCPSGTRPSSSPGGSAEQRAVWPVGIVIAPSGPLGPTQLSSRRLSLHHHGRGRRPRMSRARRNLEQACAGEHAREHERDRLHTSSVGRNELVSRFGSRYGFTNRGVSTAARDASTAETRRPPSRPGCSALSR